MSAFPISFLTVWRPFLSPLSSLFLWKVRTPDTKWEKTDEAYKIIKDLVARLDPKLKGRPQYFKTIWKNKQTTTTTNMVRPFDFVLFLSALSSLL